MPRGGHREKAGRKATWKNSETQVIRVPKVFVSQLIEIARELDNGESLDSVTQSKNFKDLPRDEIDSTEVKISPGQLNFSILEIDEVSCPRCKSTELKKNGKEAGRQKYKCKNCGKYFIQKQYF